MGVRYKFYFKQGERSPLGSEYLNTMMVSDLFLGFEMVVDVKNKPPP